jgi:putative Mn2+ efflux pump MntP
MPFIEILALSVALAMDATAVAGTRGLAAARVRVQDALLVGALFGGAQAGMPVIGWALGETVAARVSAWSHWVTFSVLVVLGGKMIREAIEEDEDRDATPPFGLKVLTLLAIATSIDALAAGVTLALRGVEVALACTTIGAVTFALSFAGVYVGHRFGTRIGKRLDVLGGVVLVALGVKALVDHYR